MSQASESVQLNSRIDLHCHTTASDGALAPSDLLQRAAGRGIETLAITDHDTLAGYRSVKAEAEALGISLITGIELSCVWSGVTIHIVGLNVDAESEVMLNAESIQTRAREERAELIVQRVGKKLGQSLDLEAVRQYAGGDAIGRPHIAQYLVEQKLVPDMRTAFSKYLGSGKVGDVKTHWPDMSEAVRWIVDAGGIPVMAHAHHYKMTRTKLRNCLRDFVAAGGQALEVAYGLMDNNQRGQMTVLAKEFGLMGSCGSDFHGPNRFGLDLGVMCDFPKDIQPVWTVWQSPSAAAEAQTTNH